MERYSNEYTPDSSFVKHLKRLDPRLGCKYRRDLGKFAITWSMPVGSPSEVMIVQNENGTFKQPDSRDLLILQEGDIHRTDIKERMNKTVNYMRDYQEQVKKTQSDEIRNATKEDKHQLMNAYRKSFNLSGKNAPAFRQVIPKAKGEKVTIKKNRKIRASVLSENRQT